MSKRMGSGKGNNKRVSVKGKSLDIDKSAIPQKIVRWPYKDVEVFQKFLKNEEYSIGIDQVKLWGGI